MWGLNTNPLINGDIEIEWKIVEKTTRFKCLDGSTNLEIEKHIICQEKILHFLL